MLRYKGIHRKSGLPTNQNALALSLALNSVLVVVLLFIVSSNVLLRAPLLGGGGIRSEKIEWNGGHPAASRTGSCYCSDYDNYCMCTPSLAIDLVITSGSDSIWLVRRKDTDQLATMGGFVMVGETVENAVKRELMEEMGIELQTDPILVGVYSDSRRDNRRHTVSAVYVVHLDGSEKPKAADDVKNVKKIPIEDIEKYTYFADHKTILLDYRRARLQGRFQRAQGLDHVASDLDFAGDIVRSLC